MAENSRVAVLGTGIMGAAMARNLREAGMEVRAWNRSREKAEPLADDGATVSDTPAEAAADADFLLTMLSDADVIAEVVDGEVLGALNGGAVWIQTSTVGTEGNERLEAIAVENDVSYVDAPVLGTKAPAEQGQLIVLASGPDSAREKCAPSSMLSAARRCGSGRRGPGAGSSWWSTTGSWASSACWQRRSRSRGRPAWIPPGSWRPSRAGLWACPMPR